MFRYIYINQHKERSTGVLISP